MDKVFTSPKENVLLTSMTSHDLLDYIVQLAYYYLEYRDMLLFPNTITFGTEIEYEFLARGIVDRFFDTYRDYLKGWESDSDGSLTCGGEIRSHVMKNCSSDWKELEFVCYFLSRKRAWTAGNAGGHIHVGADILGTRIDSWEVFLKAYILYEHVLFRSTYGDKISGRNDIYKYASPISKSLFDTILEKNGSRIDLVGRLIYKLPQTKHIALNFQHLRGNLSSDKEKINTFEFRGPDASINAIIWQNNINILVNLMSSSTLDVIDKDFLDYKLKHEYVLENRRFLYNEVCLKDALEFADLIFNNNLDKSYFLRQYLKSFEDNYGIKGAVYAKRFTNWR